LVALVLIGVGWFVLTRGPRSFSPDAAPVWTAVRSGRRFHTATMYTRRNCLLCDEALEQLRAYRAYLPEVSVVDIDRDPELQRRFDTSVPVVELDGRIRFRGHVSDLLLRRLIDGTPPLRESQ
jgi:glutaredoxin